MTDEPWVRNEVHAALSEPRFTLIDEEEPEAAVSRAGKGAADVAVVDLQVKSMGGMAITRSLRDATHVDGAPRVPVVLLLDRRADAFLARRAGADASIQKPFTAFDLRRAIDDVLGAEEMS